MPIAYETDATLRVQAAQLIHRARHELAQQIAALMGPPPKAAAATQAQQLEVWMRRGPEWQDPRLDDQNAGVIYAQGFDVDAVLDAMYPERRRLIRLGRPDIEQQVRFAERMARLAAKEEQLMVEGGIAQLEMAGQALDAGAFGPPIPDYQVDLSDQDLTQQQVAA